MRERSEESRASATERPQGGFRGQRLSSRGFNRPPC